MAGYSGTPLPQKLGIKDGHAVALLAAPVGFGRTLGKLPAGVRVVDALGKPGALDVVVFFTKSRADLEKRFAKIAKSLSPAGGFWVAWPKKASGVSTDMTENAVREVALPQGLVDNKVCAIDETWSGLRLVYRVENRPKLRRA
jgi:hypothetical protein